LGHKLYGSLVVGRFIGNDSGFGEFEVDSDSRITVAESALALLNQLAGLAVLRFPKKHFSFG
jgi:hypothetical protein